MFCDATVDGRAVRPSNDYQFQSNTDQIAMAIQQPVPVRS